MQYTVTSNHGELTIDAAGYIIACRTDNDAPDGGAHLKLITRFDIAEWQRYWKNPEESHIDILDLGYWYNDPGTSTSTYELPDDDWRKEIAEMLFMREPA